MSPRFWTRPSAASLAGLIVAVLLWPDGPLAEDEGWADAPGAVPAQSAAEEAEGGLSVPGQATDLWDEAELLPPAAVTLPPPRDAGGEPFPQFPADTAVSEPVPEQPRTADHGEPIDLPPRKPTASPPPPAESIRQPRADAAVEPPVTPAPPVAPSLVPGLAPMPDAGDEAPPPVDEGRTGSEAVSPPVELPPRVSPPQRAPMEGTLSHPAPAPQPSPRDMREEIAPAAVLPPAVAPEPPPPMTPRFEPPPIAQPATPAPGDWRAQWQRARRAFWEGRFDESVAAYRALIAADPQNWAAHGELGNVLYRQGEWDAAVDAFFDAARLLWQSGRTEDARHLARIIGNLQPGRDQELMRVFSAGGHDAPQYPSHSRLAKPTESQ